MGFPGMLLRCCLHGHAAEGMRVTDNGHALMVFVVLVQVCACVDAQLFRCDAEAKVMF